MKRAATKLSSDAASEKRRAPCGGYVVVLAASKCCNEPVDLEDKEHNAEDKSEGSNPGAASERWFSATGGWLGGS